ncbi:MAG: hypothetical protein QM753_11580 [Thermomicrobiales bacterium]
MQATRKSLLGCRRELDALIERFLCKSEPQHPFMAKFVNQIADGQPIFETFVRNVQRNYELSLIEAMQDPRTVSEVPPFTHRIWVTNERTPSLPPDELLGPYLRSLVDLPASATHFFWSNSEVVRSHVTERAAAVGCYNFVSTDISLLKTSAVAANVERLLADRKFVLAADVLKFAVLDRFGGIYSDLGVLYDTITFKMAIMADYSFIISGNSFFQTSFVAAPAGSDLTSLFLGVLANPFALSPSYAMLGHKVGALDDLHICAGPGFTACVLLFVPPTARIALCPAQSKHLQWRSQQSWYGKEGKHGNVLVDQSSPSILSNGQVEVARDSIARDLKVFGGCSRFAERLRILLLTASYFSTHPTRFLSRFLVPWK